MLMFTASGISVSLYNAITEAQTDALVQFMQDFIAEETKASESS